MVDIRFGDPKGQSVVSRTLDFALRGGLSYMWLVDLDDCWIGYFGPKHVLGYFLD